MTSRRIPVLVLAAPLDDGAYTASVTAYNGSGTAIANSASDRAFNVKAK